MAEKISKIKGDPEFIRLKNKQRTVPENQRFQKYLREIAALEKTSALGGNGDAVPVKKPRKVASKEVFVPKPNWRNQTKSVAWRNQNKDISKNDDARDEDYEQAYRARMNRLKNEGKFGGVVAEKRVEAYAATVVSEPVPDPEPVSDSPKQYTPLKLENIDPSIYENDNWRQEEPSEVPEVVVTKTKKVTPVRSSPPVVKKPVKKTVKKTTTKKAAAKKPTVQRKVVSDDEDDDKFIKESDDSANSSFSDAEDL